MVSLNLNRLLFIGLIKMNIDFYTYKFFLGPSIGTGRPGSQITLVFLHPCHKIIDGLGRPGQVVLENTCSNMNCTAASRN